MLKEERMKLKIAQNKMAKKLLISNCYLCKLENHPDLCNPPVKLILKLSKELEIEHTKIYLHFVESIQKE
ncbi:hypothetical protein CLPUN_52610 [Clostridium puniceum]|uniref:Helix-turn-helix domain protein n=1 Tax=Clostridium puniceum TaxID=29367 RepID=A0A1S8SY19_9CLOT|nr:helix-turn-helix transcriptional regulator [Clostridium puniceum]OOM70302.1 hypothetical protein CLPUN_52610 [Clostridium puniceum]